VTDNQTRAQCIEAAAREVLAFHQNMTYVNLPEEVGKLADALAYVTLDELADDIEADDAEKRLAELTAEREALARILPAGCGSLVEAAKVLTSDKLRLADEVRGALDGAKVPTTLFNRPATLAERIEMLAAERDIEHENVQRLEKLKLPRLPSGPFVIEDEPDTEAEKELDAAKERAEEYLGTLGDALNLIAWLVERRNSGADS